METLQSQDSAACVAWLTSCCTSEEIMTAGHLPVLPLALVTLHCVHDFLQIILKLGKEIIHGLSQFCLCHALSERKIREFKWEHQLHKA